MGSRALSPYGKPYVGSSLIIYLSTLKESMTGIYVRKMEANTQKYFKYNEYIYI